MLELDQVSRHFGGLSAVNNISFKVQSGQIIGLIGPNGAGKTTLLNLISGLDRPTHGTVNFIGKPIHHLVPHRINRLGIARTYQNIRLFADMTVIENVIVGMHTQGKASLLNAMLMLPSYWAEEKWLRAEAQKLIDRLGLSEFSRSPAAGLSYGAQRRVEIARALATHPRLLLLDEPAAGMNAIETAILGEFILSLRTEGLTVLVIEHDMAFITQVCDQVMVLNFGELIARGTPDQIKADPVVVEAYLGAQGDDNA